MHWLLAPFRLISSVCRRFLEERLTLVAAALSFDTLLSLVPMIVVGVGLLQYFPFANNMSAALENFVIANLLPGKNPVPLWPNISGGLRIALKSCL